MTYKILIVSFTRFCLISLRLANLLLLARISGVTSFGKLSLVIALLTFFSELSNLGLTSYLQRERFLGNTKGVDTALWSIRRSALIYLAIAIPLSIILSIQLKIGLALAISIPLFLLAERNFDLFISFSISSKSVRKIVVPAILSILINSLFLFLYTLAFSNLEALYFCVRFLAAIPFVAIGINFLWFRGIRPEKKLARHLYLNFGILNFANAIRTLDILLIAILCNSIEVGLYSASQKFILPVMVLMGIMAPVISNYFMEKSKNFLAMLTRYVNFVLLFLITLVIFLVPYVDSLVMFFLGSSYKSSTGILTIHLFSLPFIILNPILSIFLLVSNGEKNLMKKTILNSVLFLILVSIGAAFNGATGAAMGFLAVNLFRYFDSCKLIRDQQKIF
jgi:O-antigen/teichoic acid export membrane protein